MNNLSIESQIQELDEWIRSIQMPESKVKQELEAKLDYWLEQATNSVGGSVLGYKTKKDGVTVGLLEEPGQGGWQPFTCLNSLRNVEPSIGLILDTRIPDDDFRPPQPMSEEVKLN